MIKDAFRKTDDMAQEVLEGFKDKASCSPVPSVSREGRKPRNNGFGDSSGWSWSRNMNCGLGEERGLAGICDGSLMFGRGHLLQTKRSF